MAISKVILDGSTLLDVTNSTVNAQRILSGYVAKGADGVDVTGSYVPQVSNDFIVTLTYNEQSGELSANCTIQQFQDAYDGGKNIILDGYNCSPLGWFCDDDYSFIISLFGGGENSVTISEFWWTVQGIDHTDDMTFIVPIFDSATRTYTPTTSQQTETVTYRSGYNGLEQVSVTVNAMPTGTAGTPTATKGSVSNHSVSVTPSVTNTTGYITGSTKTGTAVTVSASELVSGTLNVTSSGTKDVTNYASASVAAGGATASATKGTVSNHSVTVTPSVTRTAGYVTAGTANGTAVTVSASELVSGSETKTANGTYDVTNLAELVVNVSGGDDSNFAHTISRSGAITSIPSSVTEIGSYAFRGCTGLTVSSLPSGVTSIGTYAFYGCTGMPLSSLPSGITVIDAYTFIDCDLLTVSTLPSGVTYIGTSAFQRCPSMTSIQGSGAITTIASSSFLGSSAKPSSLRSVKFPNANISGSLSTAFGSSTAANACQQLEEADIGKVASISANAFANCYKLRTLVLRHTSGTALANVSAFTNTPMSGYNGLTGTVYVPSSLINSYKTASNWSTLYNGGTLTFAAIEGSVWE